MRALILSVSILALALQSCREPTEEFNIGAAPTVMKALDEVAMDFRGCKVNISYASSGQIAQQVRQGAPFDLLILADKDYIEALAREGYVLEESIKTYARTNLVVWIPEDGPRLENLRELIYIPGKIAVANPEYAPSGKAAVQALRAAGLWEELKDKLVYAENLREATQYAEVGSASAAITSLSLVLDLKGHYFVIPKELYTPLEQSLAIVKGAKHEKCARDFIAHFLGPEGKNILKKHGFEVLEE
ncbi:MAG: molybdate ABC transporter substrate-binding protein [Anaerolineae bacterium]|nr:molybdate ABC transporter substrate-binding protein [Anaerolineae bacterium]MDW8103133.1 molybdate ABC transporter substrate-binding protein [Anaerolineae bacterium]